jgi:hypothetical protein
MIDDLAPVEIRARQFLSECSPHHTKREWYTLIVELEQELRACKNDANAHDGFGAALKLTEEVVVEIKMMNDDESLRLSALDAAEIADSGYRKVDAMLFRAIALRFEHVLHELAAAIEAKEKAELERDKWEADALQKLNDYKCAMIDNEITLARKDNYIVALKHDIARHVQIAAEQASQIEQAYICLTFSGYPSPPSLAVGIETLRAERDALEEEVALLKRDDEHSRR